MKKKSEIVRLLRKNYAYTLEQLYKIFEIHPQTIRAYIKDKDNPLGVMSQKPTLIWSENLREYLKTQIQAKQETLSVLEYYCLGCRKKQMPLNNVYAEQNINKVQHMRKAVCPQCGAIMNKYCSSQRLTEVLPLHKRVSLEELYILQHSNYPHKTHNQEKESIYQKDSNVKQFNLFGTNVNAG